MKVVTPARQVASRRKAARGGECGTGGHGRAGVTVQVTRLWIGIVGLMTGHGGDERSHAQRPSRPHRPAPHADLTAMIDAAGGFEEGSRAELAAATAAAVVEAGRTGADGDRFVALADQVGIDTLAALWRDAHPASLAGSLWALYLLRQWCRTNGEEVTRLWHAGQPFAAADAVVAGLPDYADVDAVQRIADAVLSGAYRGDLGVALERAAALFRVLATGRRQLVEDLTGGATDGTHEAVVREQERAGRNDRVAADLTAAAAKWRAGTLH